MPPDEKSRFINDLIGSVAGSIMASVTRMPDDWDGIELRQLIADKFAEQTLKMAGARLKSYRNEIITRNI